MFKHHLRVWKQHQEVETLIYLPIWSLVLNQHNMLIVVLFNTGEKYGTSPRHMDSELIASFQILMSQDAGWSIL